MKIMIKLCNFSWKCYKSFSKPYEKTFLKLFKSFLLFCNMSMILPSTSKKVNWEVHFPKMQAATFRAQKSDLSRDTTGTSYSVSVLVHRTALVGEWIANCGPFWPSPDLMFPCYSTLVWLLFMYTSAPLP